MNTPRKKIQANFGAFATDLSTIPTMTEDEKATLIADLKEAYEAAFYFWSQGNLPQCLLLEYGAEMKAIWNAMGYSPKVVQGAWPVYK